MEKITLEFIFTVVIGTLCVGASIALWVNRGAWLPIVGSIVSIVSGLSARARAEGVARRAYRQQVYMSSQDRDDPAGVPNASSRRSPALDRTSGLSGSAGAFQPPTIAELLEQLSDDELLEELAHMRDAAGNLKYADSRIAKFIGGRVEDRAAQVRDVRGKAPPPPKPAPQLRVRADGTERLIDKYGGRRPA